MQVKEFDSIDDGCFDSLVFNTQNIAKLVQSPLQPGFNSLAEVYMYGNQFIQQQRTKKPLTSRLWSQYSSMPIYKNTNDSLLTEMCSQYE